MYRQVDRQVSLLYSSESDWGSHTLLTVYKECVCFKVAFSKLSLLIWVDWKLAGCARPILCRVEMALLKMAVMWLKNWLKFLSAAIGFWTMGWGWIGEWLTISIFSASDSQYFSSFSHPFFWNSASDIIFPVLVTMPSCMVLNSFWAAMLGTVRSSSLPFKV